MRAHTSHPHPPAHTLLAPPLPQAMRTIYDEYNDEEVVLSKDELRMIMAIRKGQFPHVEVNPYEPEINWCVLRVSRYRVCGLSNSL